MLVVSEFEQKCFSLASIDGTRKKIHRTQSYLFWKQMQEKIMKHLTRSANTLVMMTIYRLW